MADGDNNAVLSAKHLLPATQAHLPLEGSNEVCGNVACRIGSPLPLHGAAIVGVRSTPLVDARVLASLIGDAKWVIAECMCKFRGSFGVGMAPKIRNASWLCAWHVRVTWGDPPPAMFVAMQDSTAYLAIASSVGEIGRCMPDTRKKALLACRSTHRRVHRRTPA